MMLIACALPVLLASQLMQSPAPLPSMAPSLTSREEGLAVLALEGLIEGRDKALSAVVEITPPESTVEAGAKPLLYCAFDRVKGATRFDNHAAACLTQVVRTPSETLLHVDGSSVGRHLPGYQIPLEAAKPVDLSLVGLQTLPEFDFRMGRGDFAQLMSISECTSCTRSRGGIIEIQLEYFMRHTDTRMRRTIKVDSAKDFAPLEMRCERLPGGTETWPPVGPRGSCRTEWEQIGGAWVPVKCSFDGPLPRDNGVALLKWSSVNERVPERLFSPGGLGLPNDTPLWDHRPGAPVQQLSVGGDYLDARSALKREREQGLRGWQTWRIAANCGVIIGLGVVVAAQRSRKRRSA